jgi:hypothetical protein
MKGTLYPEEWVEGYNHWFSGRRTCDWMAWRGSCAYWCQAEAAGIQAFPGKTLCTEFHKPSPRKRAHMPHIERGCA